nr:hybrid signal transduction histidine kinase M [Tanacetum cinerariifolium]
QVVTTPGNAKALYDHLKDLFHDNKDARAINLDIELCSVKIGKMSVNEYCTKIKSMANRLKNLDCDVSEKNLVIYAVNGLDSSFATLVEIIQHREPLSTFENVRNMLLLKESSFTDSTDASTMLESSSSSPTIILAKGPITCRVHGPTKFVGGLYPITKPSTLPAAFMSTSSTTWHQRLGHPRDEVLRSLSFYPNWCNAMYDKYDALVKNDTWILVPRPTDANLVWSMWLFKHRFHADGTLSRYKAGLVANGSSQ